MGKIATLTGKQAKKILEIFEDTPVEQMQAVLESGLLAKLRDANIAEINLEEVALACGLKTQVNSMALKTLRTLTIGGIPPAELVKRLTDGNFYVSDRAHDIMGKPAFTTLPKPTNIKLVQSTVADLGFKAQPTTTELFARIKEVGNFCPAEVGPHLRLADTDQERGTCYWIAMEPILCSDGAPRVFRVRRPADGLQWSLSTSHACSHDPWFLGNRIVFCPRPGSRA